MASIQPCMTQFRKTAEVFRRLLPRWNGWIGGGGLMVLLGLSACAGGGATGVSGTVDKQQAVARIAQSRWDALVKGDFDTAYGMMSPASRSVITPEVFRKKLGLVTWKAASVKKVECQADDICTAQVGATYAHQMRGGVRVENEQLQIEVWRNIEGGWWYVHADSL